MNRFIGPLILGIILYVIGVPWWGILLLGGFLLIGWWLVGIISLIAIYLYSYFKKFKENYHSSK